MISMHADWIDLFRLFREGGVRYLVVGGYAVALYGFERYTKDIDLWIARDRENAEAVVGALREFGFSGKNLDPKSFINPRKVIMLGAEPFRIDIIVQMEALDFNSAWPDRVVRKNMGVPINYVSLAHLKILKAASTRFVDQRDLEALAYCHPSPKKRRRFAGDVDVSATKQKGESRSTKKKRRRSTRKKS